MDTNILLERFETEKKLIASTEYFDWLYEFTKTYPKFSDTTWLYEDNPNLTEEDNKNIDQLQLFFSAIDNYHEKNLVSANVEGYTCWYNVKYKDVYFAIGLIVGQGATNFAVRYGDFGEMGLEPYVNFESIMEDKELPGIEDKKQALVELKTLATALHDMKVPKEKVTDIVAKAYDKK